MSNHVGLRAFEALLSERIGLDPASIGHDEVARAVTRRCRETGNVSIADYLVLASHSTSEWEELVELVLVPETWFFREPTAFDLVAVLARRHLESGTPRRFRVLSLPCATGEEPYSIAIVLMDAGLTPDRFCVDAIDISHRAVTSARLGRYGSRSVRHVGPDRLSRYFDAGGTGRAVRADLRAAVEFSTGNLVDPTLLANETPYDVVFCRNVLIYFDARARAKVLGTLERLVRDDGLLVTGHAEVLRLVAPVFVGARVPRTFAYRKRDAAPVPAQSPPASRLRRLEPASVQTLPSLARPAPEMAGRAGRRAPGRSPDAARPEMSWEQSALAEARALADSGALDRARACLAELSSRRPDLVEAHYLAGVVEIGSGRPDDAERAFRRAVYLDPRHHEALTHLALLRERRGDTDDAARLRRRAALARPDRGPSAGSA